MSETLKIQVRGKRGVLFGRKLTSEEFDLTRDIPGFKKWVDYDLYFELTGQNINFMLKHFKHASWDQAFNVFIQHAQDIDQLAEETILAKLEAPPPELATFPFRHQPFKHQMTCLNICKDRVAFGLFMEMGTGKTKVLIDNAAYLYFKDKIDLLVVLAPNGVHEQWATEQVPEHMPFDVPWKTFVYKSGKGDKILAEIKKDITTKEVTDCFPIVCVNIEAMSGKSGVEFMSKVIKLGRSMMAVDESSKIKNQSAKRTESCIEVGKSAVYRRILSGTPVTKGVQDLYSQFAFLDPWILGFSSFYTFRNRYCIMGGFENKQITAYKNLLELQEKIDAHAYRVLKEECLDLPERIFTRRDSPWDPEQKKLYDQLKDEFIIELNDKTMTAALAMTRLMKLQQILCGHLRMEKDAPYQRVPTNRFKTTMEALDEIDGKTIIWARFQPDIEQLQEHLEEAKLGFVTYRADKSEEIKKRFREDDNCSVFLGNPQSAGIGLNLTASNFTIWFSPSFSYEDYKQANDRNHRTGQTKKVTYIHLYTPASVDTRLYTSLRNKQNLADTLLDIREVLTDPA